jgi:hypothetical protein
MEGTVAASLVVEITAVSDAVGAGAAGIVTP